jgi:Carboxypeptidase regulatory-like domain/TonB-dependent Receptor Plug Domain
MAITSLVASRRLWLIGAVATRLGAQQPAPVQQSKDTMPPNTTPATLIGRVTDSAGVGLNGAEILLLRSDRPRAITGDSGDFRIAGLPPGTVVFNVRRIGYEAATFTAVLKPGKTHRTNFAMTATAYALPTVAVSDTQTKSHWLDQFNARKFNGHGTFITRNEIVKRGARTGIDVIRGVPGVRVLPSRNGMTNRVTMSRTTNRACPPTMYLHGLPYSGTMDDFSADEIEAVELYVGVSEIPPEYDRNERGICGVIVVWTRDPRAFNRTPPGAEF